MLNKKFYEDKAEELTKEYLKNNPDLKFIVVYGEDDKGNQIASFKIVKIEDKPVEKVEDIVDKAVKQHRTYNRDELAENKVFVEKALDNI